MENPLRSKKAEWLVTMPSFLWLAVFFAIPAVIVLAFTFHGHDASGGRRIAALKPHSRFLLDQEAITWNDDVFVWWHPDDGYMVPSEQ